MPIPCDIATVVQNNCGRCHGPQPIGGAIRLVTHGDWHRVSPFYGPTQLGDPSKLVYQVAQIRINDGSMPQGAQMAAPDLDTLNTWLAGGAVAGTAADATCGSTGEVITPPAAGAGGTPTAGAGGTMAPTAGAGGAAGMANAGAGGTAGMMNAGAGGTAGTAGGGGGGATNLCNASDAYEPLVAEPGETCYDFKVHGQGSYDVPFTVQGGEAYHQWYYDIPWSPGTQATRFGADFDNIQVLHHWLAFASSSGNPDGTLLENVTGTTLGESANLIGGWAVGGCNVVFPDNMGLQLPSTGKIMVQWHMYNSTGSPQQDGTKVQFCTVPPNSRPNVGGLTWLGTENFNGVLGMPAGMSEFSGTCINDSTGPISIVAFWPHMHEIGINMRSDIWPGGDQTKAMNVFDEPFDFNYQVHYEQDPPVVLQPGDAIYSTCTFFNDTGANVAFGQSTKAEMCYQFAFSYPAGALDNGVLSLIGATNTCWQFGE